MNEKEIITKAVKKAYPDREFEIKYLDRDYWNSTEILAIIWVNPAGERKFDQVTIVSEILFDHDFAKALWGDSWAYFTKGISGDTINGNFINYLGHLANMVVSGDPIKYLEQNI